ncbi:MAG: hypothetical protein K8953_02230, partial [Proteobacteria bacterium]|nr:hypothetical protein [Pseudomonadota bacterium]
SETDLGAVQPNTTASAIWYGRLFAKTDATAFNLNNDKQVGLDVNFGEGTIDTPRPVEFTIGAQTHTVSIRGRFGLNSFARGSDVPSATGLLSGFVEYTHHGANTATKFDLIGLIGEEGALGIFKGRVAGVNLGLIGGFEASPDTGTYIPDNDSYLKQFGAYINDQLRGGDIRSQIAKGEAHNVKVGNTPNYQATFRLGGLHSHDNNAASGTNIADGFAFAVFTPGRHKGVGILSGTDLGAVVTSSTPSAIWAGRLYVNPAYTAADTAYAKLDLRVNFGAGTIETLAPISIVAYKGGSPSTRKQTLEIEGIFGSHLDAHGLRTGTLGGSIIYKVGHLTPTQAAAVARTATYTNDEVTKHSVTTAYLPLRGLIGADGAIGVF